MVTACSGTRVQAGETTENRIDLWIFFRLKKKTGLVYADVSAQQPWGSQKEKNASPEGQLPSEILPPPEGLCERMALTRTGARVLQGTHCSPVLL